MTGPGYGTAPWAAGGHGRMRASHADREQVIGTLKAAFVQGRLDKAEFDLRVGRTFASRTYADLAAVTADLPAGLADTRPANPAPARSGRPGRIFAIATTLYAGGWLGALLLSGPEEPAGLVMAYLGTVIYLCVLIVVAVAALEARHDRRPGRQLGRGQGPGGGGPSRRRPPSGNPGRRYPPAAPPGHWHRAQAARPRRSQPSLRGLCPGQPFRPWPAPASG